MHIHFFKFFILSFLFAGCTVVPTRAPESQISKLSNLLQALGKHIPKSESKKLSRDIFLKTEQLTKDFKLTSPPLWHNFLINVGVRKKGLCYHWSDALYIYLKSGHYRDYTFHMVGANIGEYFFEHNALVIISRGDKIKNGVIIDPWRNSGKLYFSMVKDDVKYVWSHRKDRGCP